MLKFTDQENSKLEILGSDIVLIEALRKHLLNICLKHGTKDLPELAASRLAMDYVELGIRELEIKKEQRKESQEGNIGL